MKIYEEQGLVLQEASKGIRKKDVQGVDFQKIMEEKIIPGDREKGTVVQVNREPVISGVQILRGAEKVASTPLEPIERSEILDEISSTLDLVDFYAQKLADTSISAEGMNPLVDRLEERLEGLRRMETSKGLPDQLRPILSDVVLTMGTEIAKFRRGDYV